MKIYKIEFTGCSFAECTVLCMEVMYFQLLLNSTCSLIYKPRPQAEKLENISFSEPCSFEI